MATGISVCYIPQVYGCRGHHNHPRILAPIQRPINTPTTANAMRHVFSPPGPIPNAWLARRDVWDSTAPNEPNWFPCGQRKTYGRKDDWENIYRIVQHQLLALNVIVDVRRYLEVKGKTGSVGGYAASEIGPTPRKVRILECSSSNLWSFWAS